MNNTQSISAVTTRWLMNRYKPNADQDERDEFNNVYKSVITELLNETNSQI